jgi:hypothetical protein
VIDQTSLQKLKYKVSLCYQEYTLTTSYDDGIVSIEVKSCKGYKRSELCRSLTKLLTRKHDQGLICLICSMIGKQMRLVYLYSSASGRLKEICPQGK